MRPPMEDRARAYVAKMDGATAGSGGHNQTFYVACVLVHAFELGRETALGILREFNGRCSPPWSEADLTHKIQSAAGSAPSKAMLDLRDKIRADERPGDRLSRPAVDAPLPAERPVRPDYDAGELKRMAEPWNGVVSSVWLANRSVVDPFDLDAAGFLKLMYPEGERVLVFTDQRSQGQALWPVDAVPVRGAEGVWFLPQPVDGQYHPNPRSTGKDGKPKSSRRSMESITAWRYMLLESDEADMRDWLGLLVKMPLRIAAIYSSGGRSVHALIRLDKKTKSGWDAEKAALEPCLNLLCVAGVDMKAITAVRLSRLPQCWRGRKRQKLFYVNPDPPVRPLIEMPERRDVEAEWCQMAAAGISDADPAGGKWLFDGLAYYASASVACRDAWMRLKEEYGEE